MIINPKVKSQTIKSVGKFDLLIPLESINSFSRNFIPSLLTFAYFQPSALTSETMWIKHRESASVSALKFIFCILAN